jgi:hypothetical protein
MVYPFRDGKTRRLLEGLGTAITVLTHSQHGIALIADFSRYVVFTSACYPNRHASLASTQ